MDAPARWIQHAEDTRNGLIEAARELFTENGYEATSTEDIAQRARVSKGAMYHHFTSKEDLFTAVLDKVESEFIAALVEKGAPGDTVWEEIQNGCQSFLDVVVASPDVQRIMLIDGPAVLGWVPWRELEMKYGFGLLEDFLQRAIDEGYLPDRPVRPLTHLVMGAINEAALVIAHSTDRKRVRKEMGQAFGDLLASLANE